MRQTWFRFLPLVAFVFCVGKSHAQTTPADHTFERAGNSQSIAPWARSSRTAGHQPGYIGGSAVLGGEGVSFPSDGVFGYDYVGHGPADRVFLGWLHTHTAPPAGPYRTDTHRVYDVFSIRPVRKALANGAKVIVEVCSDFVTFHAVDRLTLFSLTSILA